MFGPNLTIIVSIHEKESPVVKYLQKLGLQVRYANLKMGDFLLSGTTAIERKDSKEFIKSIEDKSIFRQLIDFKREFSSPLYIIEGCNLYAQKNINATKIRSAISYITILNNIPVIFTQDPKDSAEYIYMISRQAQHGLTFNPLADKKKQKFSEDSDAQLAVIETLPDIGAAIAMAMLKQFGTLKGVFNATKKTLMSVDGIGEKRAQKLVDFLNKRYDQ